MAPAIAHFLVGAGLVLVGIAPIALRYELDHSSGMWLVPLGGLWGLVPDIHNIAPVYQTQLHTIHYSPWMDLFALHYLLDRPTVRAMYLESIFGSILFFLLAVALFSLAQMLQTHVSVVTTPIKYGIGIATLTIVAIAIAGIVSSALVLNLERYDMLAALIGREGLVAGWFVLAAGSLAVGLVLSLTFEFGLSAEVRTNPRSGLAVGVVIATIGWLVASVIVPLWLRTVSDVRVAVPAVDLPTLFILASFTGGFTLVYTLVRGAELFGNQSTASYQ